MCLTVADAFIQILQTCSKFRYRQGVKYPLDTYRYPRYSQVSKVPLAYVSKLPLTLSSGALPSPHPVGHVLLRGGSQQQGPSLPGPLGSVHREGVVAVP